MKWANAKLIFPHSALTKGLSANSANIMLRWLSNNDRNIYNYSNWTQLRHKSVMSINGIVPYCNYRHKHHPVFSCLKREVVMRIGYAIEDYIAHLVWDITAVIHHVQMKTKQDVPVLSMAANSGLSNKDCVGLQYHSYQCQEVVSNNFGSERFLPCCKSWHAPTHLPHCLPLSHSRCALLPFSSPLTIVPF